MRVASITLGRFSSRSSTRLSFGNIRDLQHQVQDRLVAVDIYVDAVILTPSSETKVGDVFQLTHCGRMLLPHRHRIGALTSPQLTRTTAHDHGCAACSAILPVDGGTTPARNISNDVIPRSRVAAARHIGQQPFQPKDGYDLITSLNRLSRRGGSDGIVLFFPTQCEMVTTCQSADRHFPQWLRTGCPGCAVRNSRANLPG